MNLSFRTVCSHPVLLCIILDTAKWWMFSIFQFKKKNFQALKKPVSSKQIRANTG